LKTVEEACQMDELGFERVVEKELIFFRKRS